MNRIVDGDTIDVTIDLGFSININQRVRVACIDSTDMRTRDAAEKALGIDATEWMTKRINEAPELIIKTAVEGSMGKYGRVLGEIFIQDKEGKTYNVNETLISEGHAYVYEGGTKKVFTS